MITKAELIFDWKRLQEFAVQEGFQIENFGEVKGGVSVNELDVIAELEDRLVFYAKRFGSGKVSACTTAFGSPAGGVRMKFSDPGQATLFKLSWP